jgi:hypothetical protein
MKTLKIIGLIALSFLLFISLNLICFACIINQTVLKPEFIIDKTNQLDITSLANEVINDHISDDLPEAIKVSLITTVDKTAPEIKEKLDSFIHYIYDYITGKQEVFSLSDALQDTFLDMDFINQVINELDTKTLVKPIMQEQFSHELPDELDFVLPYIEDATGSVLIEQESWIDTQLKEVAESIIPYLIGEQSDLEISIPTDTILSSFKIHLLDSIMESPPQILASLPPQLLEASYEVLFDEFSKNIPNRIEITEEIIGSDVPSELAQAFEELEYGLSQIRKYVSYFNQLTILLVILSILFIIAIVFLCKSGKCSLLTLGIVFFTVGITQIICIFLTNNYFWDQQIQLLRNMPEQLYVFALMISNEIGAILQLNGIIGLIIGSVMIICSFLYRPALK